MNYKKNVVNNLKRSMAFILVLAMVLTSMGISGWGEGEAYADATVYSDPVKNAIDIYYGGSQNKVLDDWEELAAVYSYLEGKYETNEYDTGVEISDYILPATGDGVGGLFIALMKGDAVKAETLANSLVSSASVTVDNPGYLYGYALNIIALEAYNRNNDVPVYYSTKQAIDFLLENQKDSGAFLESWGTDIDCDAAGFLLTVLSLPTFDGYTLDGKSVINAQEKLITWIKQQQSATGTGAFIGYDGNDSANTTAIILYGLVASSEDLDAWTTNPAVGLVDSSLYNVADGWFLENAWDPLATKQATLALVDVDKGSSFYTNIELNSKHYISTTMQLIKADGSFVDEAVTVVTGTSLGDVAFKVSGSAVSNGLNYYESGLVATAVEDGSTILAVANTFKNITYFSSGGSKLGVPEVKVVFGASVEFTINNLELSTGAVTTLPSVAVDNKDGPYLGLASDDEGNFTITPIDSITNLEMLEYSSFPTTRRIPSDSAILPAKIKMAKGGTQTKAVSIRIEGPNDNLAYYTTYEAIGDGSKQLTAGDAVTQVLATKGIGYTYSGGYLSEVGGVGEGFYGGWDGWAYYVNGIPGSGLGSQVISDGDEVVVYYGYSPGWGTDMVSLGSSISGEVVTLTVLNGDKSVTGVTISWNGAPLPIATDVNGQSTIQRVSSGTYSVQISKRDASDVPAVVRLPAGTTVTINDSGESSQNSGQGEEGTANEVFLTVKGLRGEIIYSRTGQTYVGNITARDVLNNTNLRVVGSADYVTAINGLSEFDYGPFSGWKYEVNGVEIGVGANSYSLSIGDDVVWRYTINYKTDSGSSAWKEEETKSTEFVAKEDGKGSATVGVTKAEMDKLIKGGGALKAKSSLATIELDPDTVKGLGKLMGKDLEITAKKIDISQQDGITQEMKDEIGERPVLDLTVMSGGKQISNFDGKVTVSIPYTLKPGEDPSSVVLYLLRDDGILEMIKNATFDSKTGQVIFTTDHFSLYGIGHKDLLFGDIQGHWAKDYITYLAARDYITGMTKTSFDPNGTLTRGQFVQLLANLAGADLDKYGSAATSVISDVKATDWFAPSVAWAVEQGIVTGITMADGTTKFNPNNSISRQDIAVMLNRYRDKIEKKAFPEVVKEKAFQDKTQIGDYAKDAVKALQMSGIIQGKSERVFAPLDQAKRGEAAKMIHGMLNLN